MLSNRMIKISKFGKKQVSNQLNLSANNHTYDISEWWTGAEKDYMYLLW